MGSLLESPYATREALTTHEVALSEPIAQFVGLVSYEAAGGIIRRDQLAAYSTRCTKPLRGSGSLAPRNS